MNARELCFLAIVSLLAGCAAAPAPAPGHALLAVAIEAAPARAVVAREAERGTEGGYGPGSGSLRGFERVDYGRIEEILVTVDGPALKDAASGPCPHTGVLRVAADGFRPRCLLLAAGPGSALTIENATGEAIEVFALGDAASGFDVTVPAGERVPQPLPPPGEYRLGLESRGNVTGRLLIAPTTQAALAATGMELTFDLPPGRYTVRVAAPRLPAWTKTVDLAAGERERVEAVLTVDLLE